MNLAWRIYRRLARAFPHEFQMAYGPEVTRLGEDVIDDIARRHGILGLVRLITDIAVRVPLEYLSEMRGDMRYAWRGLRRSPGFAPGFALVGIVSMGLGIGLTTNVYSPKWALLFRELPGAANAKRLVMMASSVSAGPLESSADTDLVPVSYYYIEQFREQKELFSGLAAFQMNIPFNVTLPGFANGKAQRTFGQLVSPEYFSVLGVQPQQGRLQVLALVLREGAALVTVGSVLGFVGAIALARIVSALMHMFADALEIGTADPRLLICPPLPLAAVALLACYLPARRAAKVDPLLALRQE